MKRRDVLTGMGAIPQVIDVLADVSGSSPEAFIKIDEGNASSRAEPPTVLLPAPPGPISVIETFRARNKPGVTGSCPRA